MVTIEDTCQGGDDRVIPLILIHLPFHPMGDKAFLIALRPLPRLSVSLNNLDGIRPLSRLPLAPHSQRQVSVRYFAYYTGWPTAMYVTKPLQVTHLYDAPTA